MLVNRARHRLPCVELLDGGAMIIAFLRSLFCRHKRLSWVRTTHGDEINLCGGMRTVMHCDDCGSFIYHPDYITEDMAISIYKEKSNE
jgi:hypothetical protein